MLPGCLVSERKNFWSLPCVTLIPCQNYLLSVKPNRKVLCLALVTSSGVNQKYMDFMGFALFQISLKIDCFYSILFGWYAIICLEHNQTIDQF